MSRKVILGALMLTLVACGGRSRGPAYSGHLITPKGRYPAQWQILCRTAIANCYAAAHKACPAGWERVDIADHSSGTVNRSASAFGGDNWAVGKSETTVSKNSRWEWIIECGSRGERAEAATAR